MKMIKEIHRGMCIPAWYGVAWVIYEADITICMPIPLNLIAAFMRAFWLWMRWGYRSVPVDPRDAYRQGFKDGSREGE
jgi:hypothetical protein